MTTLHYVFCVRADTPQGRLALITARQAGGCWNAHASVKALRDVKASHQPQSSKNVFDEFLQDWKCLLLWQDEGRTVSAVMLSNWVSAHLPATAGLLLSGYTVPAWDALTDSSCMQATNCAPRSGVTTLGKMPIGVPGQRGRVVVRNRRTQTTLDRRC